jgi:hypothetical protein
MAVWVLFYGLLPLLAMSFISVLGCASIITGSTINYTVFFYGHVVSGFPGMLVVAGVALACGYVGWGAFTRKMHAWCVCASINFTRLDTLVFYFPWFG